jgi:hypothetical protein
MCLPNVRRSSHAVLPPPVLWHNRQTEARLVLRPKPRKYRGDFEAQTGKPIITSFEAKPEKTVDLGFGAQPRNPGSTSPHARCKPHIAPPDLSITRPPSTRPMRPSSVLCTRSPSPATMLVVARHVAPTTCTPRDKQTRFSNETKNKGKTTKMS